MLNIFGKPPSFLNRLKTDFDFNFVAYDRATVTEALVIGQAELSSIQFQFALEANSFLALEILLAPCNFKGKGDFFCHSMQRQIADTKISIALLFNPFAAEDNLREPRGIKELRTAQIVIPISVLCVYAGRVDVNAA